jgi:hypothetical protein
VVSTSSPGQVERSGDDVQARVAFVVHRIIRIRARNRPKPSGLHALNVEAAAQEFDRLPFPIALPALISSKTGSARRAAVIEENDPDRAGRGRA